VAAVRVENERMRKPLLSLATMILEVGVHKNIAI
jgi:hypothetical protein